MTIDEAIRFLLKAKDEIGGNKNLILSLVGSGLEDMDVTEFHLVDSESSQYVEILILHPGLLERGIKK